MYLLVIEDDSHNKKYLFQVFSTIEKLEKWINSFYYYMEVPVYKIIEFDDIDGENKFDEPTQLDLEDL